MTRRLDLALALNRPTPAAPARTPIVAVAAVLGALALVVLDAAIVNVALPTLSRSLHVTASASVLVITAYQAGLVIALLPCAALGESLGCRRVFIAGAGLFTLTSGLCAIAPTLSWLVAARFAQGLGAAAVMALGVALLRTVVPAKRLGTAIGWNALVVALTSAAGPSIGALVLTYTAWPWLFAVNLPLGVLVLFAARTLPAKPGSARALDLVSIALNMTGFGLLIASAEALSQQPLIACALAAGGALSLRSLVRRERLKASPLLPLDLLKAPSFRLSVIASICCFTGQAAGLVALPFYLQHTLGLTPLETGLYITPWPLMVAVSATLAGRLANTSSTAWLCAAGCGVLSAGLLAASVWPLADDPVTILPIVMLCGLGFGLFQVTNNRNMFLSAPKARTGAAGGLQSLARLTGQTIGVVVMTLLFTAAPIDLAPRIGLAVGAVLVLAAGLLSTRHRRAQSSAANLTSRRC